MIKLICAHPIFNENAFIFSQKAQIPIENDFSPKKGDLYVVFGAHELAPTLWNIQRQMSNEIGYIIMNSEQLSSNAFRNKYYIWLCQSNPTFHFSQELGNVLHEKFDIEQYSYFFFDFISSPQVDHEYDIVFVGTRNERRRVFENLLRDTIPEARIHFEYDSITNAPAHLTDLYSKSKIVINIPFYDDSCLETHRINKALACGCNVVSIKSGDEHANKFYDQYIYFCDHDAAMIDFLHANWKNLIRKKDWVDFNRYLGPRLYGHSLSIIHSVHQKLLTKLGMTEHKSPEPKKEEIISL